MDEFLQQLRALLGLGVDASQDDILKCLSAVTEREASAAHRGFDPARYVAVTELQQALGEINTLKLEFVRDRAVRAVDDAIRSGKLVPAHREWAIAYCMADAKGFDTFAARQPVVLAGELNLGGDPKAALARARVGAMLSGSEIAICGLLGVSPGDFLKRKSGGTDFLRLNQDQANPNL